MEQLNTQFACHFQITYYKLTHGTYKSPLQIMMPDSFFRKSTYSSYYNGLELCWSHN